jgi:type IV fimbrial biogenesis protein FimT
MVTITLAAIVMGIGVPSYQNLVVKNRIQTQADEIRSSLAMARVEAISRGLRVRVCPGTNGCVGANWHDGWNSFVDRNNDNTRDDAANETALEVHIRLDGGSTLTGARKVIFKSDGTVVHKDGYTLSLCTADKHAQHRRRIGISTVGRVRVCKPPAAAGEPACDITCP